MTDVATICIKVAGNVLMIGEFEIDDIKEEYTGAKTIYSGSKEITIPSHAIEEKSINEDGEDEIRYLFDSVEVYINYV